MNKKTMAAFALAGLLPMFAHAAPPVPEAATLADCDVPVARTLVADAAPALDARAYWLDRAHLQWPGRAAAAGQRFALYHAAHGLSLVVGEVASPAERIALRPFSARLAADAPLRFIGAGARLQLPAGAVARLPELLRGELVLALEDAAGRLVDATRLQTPGALDDLDAADAHAALGAQPAPRTGATRFALWAPTAERVAVCRYAGPEGAAVAVDALARAPRSGVWQATLAPVAAADTAGQGVYYRYAVDVYVPGTGLVRNLVTDPYSVSLSADSARSLVADLNDPALAPPPWRAQPRPAPRANADLVIYELHVRDFSANDATVPAAHRGKYLAFTDRDAAGMRHLAALARAGVTDVHLLPVFDFASVPERGCSTPAIPPAGPASDAQQAAAMADAAHDCFNWGYDPWHFGAPEGSYASDAMDGRVRVREFRAMVAALHEAGLRVGMDVVYNHTDAAGQAATSVLDRIVPGYYQRLDATGAVEHSTCCANTATEHRMMARLMIDTAVRWVRDYGVDSLRFDLMGHQPRAAMEALQAAVDRARGGHVALIGEGWNFGEVADGRRFVQASQLSLNGSGIATFSDRGRDAARGGSAGDAGAALVANQGWLNGLQFDPNADAPRQSMDALDGAADLLRVSLAGSLRAYRLETWQGPTRPLAQIRYGDQPAGYVSEPGEVVNYVENHDNQTLFDIDALRLPAATSREDRARVQILGAALVAFSQGVAYFHAGVDLLRSKSLDRNSFDSGDGFNRIDWSGQDNGFGAGLPPKADNGADWPRLAPRLADVAIKPTPADIAWTEQAFADLLKIRASTTLLHLPNAREIERRLRFINAGPHQNPLVLAATLDGRGLAGAGFGRLAYFINTGKDMQTLLVPAERGRAWRLHPVLAAPDAADARAKQARFDPLTGLFSVPPRTAVVFVGP